MNFAELERRILALTPAERVGKDIHKLRAAEELGIDPEDVTPEQRAAAKTLNFIEAYGGRIDRPEVTRQ